MATPPALVHYLTYLVGRARRFLYELLNADVLRVDTVVFLQR